MKFMCLLAVLFVLSLYCSRIKTLKVKSQLTSMAETSIMEFLGNLYQEAETSDSVSENQSNFSANNEVNSNDKSYETALIEEEAAEEGPAPAPAPAAAKPTVNKLKVLKKNQLVSDPTEMNLIQQGYLRVSTKQFLNENIYPKIMLPNFDQTYIATDENSSFRINKMFDPSKAKDPAFPPSEQSFYFRLSFKNLWYSYMSNNVEVLGSIPVNKIVTAEIKILEKKNPQAFCFNIIDKIGAKWELCAETSKDRLIWVCKIKQLKKIDDPTCSIKNIEQATKLADVPVTYFERKVSQPIILIPQANRFCNDDWNYESKGTDWECDCKEGSEQSPINIVTSQVIQSPVVPVFTYTEVEVKKTENTDDGQIRTHKYVKMQNENHQLKIEADSFGSVVTLDGTSYNAHKIVFHTPSEHQIDGRQYPMEMQIIHKGTSEGAISNHVILSFLFEKKPGVYNKFLDDVDFFNLPNMMVKEKKMENDLYIPKIFYNSDNDDIPVMKPFSVYTYQGSLTSPPCTQRVIHYVAAEPIEVGSTALDQFQEAIRVPDMRNSKGEVIVSTLTNENNRAIQPLNGRNVYYYKVEKEEIAELKQQYTPPKPEGHYEKIIKKIKNYYYVNNNHPSGMPGSIVVSEEEAKGIGL